MSKATIKPNDAIVNVPTGTGALLKYLEKNGRLPPVTLSIYPLEDLRTEIFIDKFISYNFQSSILIPVDSFSCEVYYEKINGVTKPKEGDIMVLRCNGLPIATGIIDQLDMETEGMSGSRLSIQGRDLLSQFEDQDAVSLDSKILWGNKYSINQVITALSAQTRIDPTKLIKRTAPTRPYLFATQPGESKLSALQRYCESLDIYFWMNGDGNMIIGKPDMYGVNTGGRKGTYFLNKQQRATNCIGMRSTRNSTQIPNLILPIWNGQETVQTRISPSQFLKNSSPGPARLLALNHRVPKAVIVSTPEGSAPQDLAELNALTVAGQNSAQQKLTRAGASTILQAYAKREMARANLRDLQVQVTVAGHCNADALPLQVDQVYRVQYDVDDVDEDMYLYEVDYSLSENEGQRTRLFFCRQTALVSDVRAL